MLFRSHMILLQQGSYGFNFNFNFSTLKSAQEKKFKAATIPNIFLDNALNEVEHPLFRKGAGDNIEYEIYAVKEEELEPLRYIIEKARYLIEYSTGEIDRIVGEEITALFAGSKSAEDTALTIQNRVQLYLNEFK